MCIFWESCMHIFVFIQGFSLKITVVITLTLFQKKYINSDLGRILQLEHGMVYFCGWLRWIVQVILCEVMYEHFWIDYYELCWFVIRLGVCAFVCVCLKRVELTMLCGMRVCEWMNLAVWFYLCICVLSTLVARYNKVSNKVLIWFRNTFVNSCFYNA